MVSDCDCALSIAGRAGGPPPVGAADQPRGPVLHRPWVGGSGRLQGDGTPVVEIRRRKKNNKVTENTTEQCSQCGCHILLRGAARYTQRSASRFVQIFMLKIKSTVEWSREGGLAGYQAQLASVQPLRYCWLRPASRGIDIINM